MSDMPGNPLFVTDEFGAPRANEVTATLALAWEQRTATLLTLYIHIERQGDLPDHAGELFSEIASRLGLQEEA